MRLLDIIVPHYNETWDVCKPFFEVLENQKGVNFDDFHVFVVHDGTPCFEKSFSSKDSQLHVTQMSIPHKGVSVCRNFGLQHAKSEWVCFCDCDDCFSSIFSLMMVFHVLRSEDAKNFDMMWNQFYMHSGSNLTKMDQFNNVFIHNKYYRLSFLKEHHLKFPENLYMSEDSAFNTILHMEIDRRRIGTINSDFPLYSWCRRPGSITTDFSKWITNTEGHFERNLYILSEYKKRKYDAINLMIARTITDAYSMLSRMNIPGDPTDVLKRIAKFYQENKELYLSVPEDKLQQALAASDKDVGHAKEILDNRMPLNEWIKKYLEV